MLPHHACCVLSRLCCNEYSLLLGSYLSRIGRIENPSCSTCGHSSQDTSHLILHYPAMDSLRCSLFGDSISKPSGPDPGELLGFWGSMVFYHVPISQKGSGKQQQQKSAKGALPPPKFLQNKTENQFFQIASKSICNLMCYFNTKSVATCYVFLHKFSKGSNIVVFTL